MKDNTHRLEIELTDQEIQAILWLLRCQQTDEKNETNDIIGRVCPKIMDAYKNSTTVYLRGVKQDV